MHPILWTRMGIFMTKFTNELKIKIIKDYLSGMLLPQISKKYNINISYLNYILALYRVHGYDGLISCKKFTPQMKLKLINEVEKGNTIYSVAVKYRLSSPGIISSWIKKYNTLGYNILEKPGGRPKMSKTKKPTTSKKNIKHETKDEKIKRLEEELLYAQAKAAYLEELYKMLGDIDDIKK